MSFIYREPRGTLDDSMKTAVTFPLKEAMISYIEMKYKSTDITLEPFGMTDERTGWINEGYVLDNGRCIGMYGEIADVTDQQRIIDFLAGKLAAISGNINDKPVTPEEVIAWAEKNVKK